MEKEKKIGIVEEFFKVYGMDMDIFEMYKEWNLKNVMLNEIF